MSRNSICNLLLATAIVAVFMILLVAGCSEKEGGSRRINLAPNSFISFGPKEQDLTYFKVEAFWYGVDEDGEVDYFEIATVRSLGENGLDDIDFDALDWGRTVSRESTFVLPSDSCCLDSTDNPLSDVQLASSPWGILVRAVDNQGQPDPTPASVFFTATNVIPKVTILIPTRSTHFPVKPPHPYIEWEGDDPDGDPAGLFYKYISVPDQFGQDSVSFTHLPPIDSTAQTVGHASPPMGVWSDWVPADCTFVKDLDYSLYAGRFPEEKWAVMFVVTVKDEGDAWLPRSLFGPIYNNSRGYFRSAITRQDAGVNIILDAGAMGRRDAYNTISPGEGAVGIFQGTSASFRFWGIEDRGQGRLADAYRYYYDSPDAAGSAWNYWTSPEPVRERGNPIEWFIRFPLDGSKFTPALGSHVFVVEVRDLNKTITHAEFPVEVLEGPARLTEKKILLVDDNRHSLFENIGISTAILEERSHAQWADILEGTNWEVHDTGPTYKQKASVRAAALATTVIWDVDLDGGEGGDQTYTQLLDVCARRGNYLHSYVKVGGNVIIIGRAPVKACAYWSDPDRLPWRSRSSQPRRGPLGWDYDFRPYWKAEENDTLFNFMWDIFGIKWMEEREERGFYNALWPCDACSAWVGPIATDPQGARWDGVFENAYYITTTRRDDNNYPLDMELMYGTAYYTLDGEGNRVWRHNSGNNVIAVYVPAKGERGHAAYIAAPLYWFDHDQMKAFLRMLLQKFEELPEGS
jgi:hypothetical protein